MVTREGSPVLGSFRWRWAGNAVASGLAAPGCSHFPRPWARTTPCESPGRGGLRGGPLEEGPPHLPSSSMAVSPRHTSHGENCKVCISSKKNCVPQKFPVGCVVYI